MSKNINPSLVLVQPRKTRPFITERLLMGRKEPNQTKHSRWGSEVTAPVVVNLKGQNPAGNGFGVCHSAKMSSKDTQL